MQKSCLLLSLIFLCTASKTYKEIYELDADDIIDSEIGDVYQARVMLNKIVDDSTDMYDKKAADLKLHYMKTSNESRRFTSNTTTAAPRNLNVTQERPRMASIPPEIRAKYMNLTVKEMKMRRMKMQIENVLSKDFKSISNFHNNGDDWTTVTRRFDKLVADFKEQDKRKPDTRRETYDANENIHIKKECKKKLMQNMEHFVYITRYRLIVPQLLRKKYWHTHRYKLGFLFALLRQLSNMQKWIWFALKKWQRGLGTLYFHMKMFEKIVQLDVEIKDIARKVRRLEYQKNMLYNPKFYDYSVEVDKKGKNPDALWG